MKTVLKPRILGIMFSLLLLCSCATQNAIHPPFFETSFNQEAGRGDWLLAKLRSESGEDLLFVIDTGSPVTILDKSLEPKLGKCLGTRTRVYGYYGRKRMGLYHAPKLYLGNIKLQTGSRVFTDDLTQIWPGRSLMGILGVDCLRHYCIQFDFASRKIRFLDPDHAGNEVSGTAFPLTILFGGVFAHGDFFGTGQTYFRPDTGSTADNDAVLSPQQFQQELKRPGLIEQWKATTNGTRVASFSKGVFGGQICSNLLFVEGRHSYLNLQFLARYLVTFNFPKRVMYLKQQSVVPLVSGYFLTIEAKQFLVDLEKNGELPGLRNDPQGELVVSELKKPAAYPFFETFDFRKKDDAATCHYSVARESKDSPWRLQKVWRTDASGQVIEKYPVP